MLNLTLGLGSRKDADTTPRIALPENQGFTRYHVFCPNPSVPN